jgi:hypothetical protein
MSSYFTLVTMLMLVASPLLIPAAITVIHAFANWKMNYLNNQPIGQRRRMLLRPAR